MRSEEAELPSDLRVPTATFLAEVVFADGDALRGRFFVPSGVSFRPGPMAPGERLNDAEDFFPFLPTGDVDPVIVSKRQVAWVTFDLQSIGDAEPSIGVLPTSEQRVTVDCRGRRLEGALVLDMPGDKSRVLDCLNRPERFLRLRNGTWLHYVSRDHITKVVEMKGA